MDNKKYIPLVIFAVTLFALAMTKLVFDTNTWKDFWLVFFAACFFICLIVTAFSKGMKNGVDGWLHIPTEEHPGNGTPILRFADKTVLRDGSVYRIKCEFMQGDELISENGKELFNEVGS